MQPKTIEAYSRAIRRVGDYFDHQIDDLSEADLVDYFTDLRETYSWSSVKLDLYGLKFHYEHVLKKRWVAPGLMLRRLVPADYFLLTYTLPAELRGLAAAHADVVFDFLMCCAWETVHRFSQNDRQLQAAPGAIAVLPTHSRRSGFQPLHAGAQEAATDALSLLWRCDGDRQDADSIDIVRSRRRHAGRCGRHLTMSSGTLRGFIAQRPLEHPVGPLAKSGRQS